MRKQVSMALLCLAAQAAAAGTIYKCKDGGRISYHDRPCGHGALALPVPAAPAPVPETMQRLARERAMLREIEDARAARERARAARANRANRTAAAQRRRCQRLRLQAQWADEDAARAARAGGEGAERARTLASRRAQALAVECPD